MTEVTPPLENTRFSSIFEYNRFMTPPLFGGGIFFPVAPEESKFIPDRGNPRWSTKKSPRLLAGDIFSGRSRGVEVYPR